MVPPPALRRRAVMPRRAVVSRRSRLSAMWRRTARWRALSPVCGSRPRGRQERGANTPSDDGDHRARGDQRIRVYYKCHLSTSAIEMATFMQATGKAAQSGFRTEIKSSGQGRNMTRFGGMSGVPMPRLMAKRPVQGSLLDDKDHRAKCRLRCGELHSRPGRDNHTQ